MIIDKMSSDLEFVVIACLTLKPELMKENMEELDEYMTKHRKIWGFLKSFYEKFGNFDTQLMYSLYDDKKEFEMFVIAISDIYFEISNFKLYKQTLIDLRKESLKDKFILEQVGLIYGRLECRLINSKEFKQKIDEIYKIADEKFKTVHIPNVSIPRTSEIYQNYKTSIISQENKKTS